MTERRVGVVGYCPPTRFDEDEAGRLMCQAFDQIEVGFPDEDIVIVSGLTNVGVIALAYAEARRRGWRTVGIACARSEGREQFPVDKRIIVGTERSHESEAFLSYIAGHVIVRVGGGCQSLHEAAAHKARGDLAFEYELEALPGE